MCDGDHAAQVAVMVVGGGPDHLPTLLCKYYRLFGWLTEMGQQMRKDRGRIGRPIAPWVCTLYREGVGSALLYMGVRGPQGPPSSQVGKYHVVGCHVGCRVGCRVMVAAGRGGNPYQIREKRGSVSRLGPVSGVRTGAGPLSAVLRLRNGLARPQLSFYHGAAIGAWDTSTMPRPCTVGRSTDPI